MIDRMFRKLVDVLLVASMVGLAVGIHSIWQAVHDGDTPHARALIGPTVVAAIVAAVTWLLFLWRFRPRGSDGDGDGSSSDDDGDAGGDGDG